MVLLYLVPRINISLLIMIATIWSDFICNLSQPDDENLHVDINVKY